MKRLVVVLLLAAQVVTAQHLSNIDLYDFLDELASSGAIELNSAVKPYSREFIIDKLEDARQQKDLLNNRQQQQLEQYYYAYVHTLPEGKDRTSGLEWLGYYYKDSLFDFQAKPILGYSLWSNDSGTFHRRWNGAEVAGSVGRLSFYASLRDQQESIRLTSPDYLNQFQTSNYKPNADGGGDYDESRGGISYGWKWGKVGVAMDQLAWGDNYNGANILSGRAPVYPAIKLELQPVRWLDFHYFHAWLKSDVIDSVNIYSNGSTNRYVLRPKYMAANLFTFRPFRQFRFSIGNSIVYSDNRVNPAYLIPFLFYKSVDRSLNGYSNLGNQLGQNSQLFFNVSSRNIRNVHLYASLFIDELALGEALDKDSQSNFISFKAGGRISNLFVQNLFLTAEYTITRPVTYRHYIPTADYASSSFNMGHYLGDNAQEVYAAIGYKPLPKLWLEGSVVVAKKGEEYAYTGQSGTATSGKGLPFMDDVLWSATDLQFRARYQVVTGAWLFGSVMVTDHSGPMDEVYSQPYFQGKLTTVQVGANVGF
ncbi:MAG: hypothetical protein RIQ47_533 [Bacteroidota bacterium]